MTNRTHKRNHDDPASVARQPLDASKDDRDALPVPPRTPGSEETKDEDIDEDEDDDEFEDDEDDEESTDDEADPETVEGGEEGE